MLWNKKTANLAKGREYKMEADEMYEIRQDVLEYIITKCHCGGMFPSIVLTQKDEKLFSIQREDSGRSLRMFKWFNFSDEKIIPYPVEIDVKPLLQIFKLFKEPVSYIEFTVDETYMPNYEHSIPGMFHIINGKREAFIPYREPEKEVMMKLTFEIKDGVPLVAKEKIPLDTHVQFSITDLQELFKNMKAIGTDFVTFELLDNFSMTAGDLNDMKPRIRQVVDCSYSGPKNVSAIYTYGFKEMAKTFDSKVRLCFSNKCPGWFHESSEKHVFGVFIPPYTGQEE